MSDRIIRMLLDIFVTVLIFSVIAWLSITISPYSYTNCPPYACNYR